MRVMFMYFDEDPAIGSHALSPLPNPAEAWRPYRSLLLLQRTASGLPHYEPSGRILELRNQDVELPYGDDSQFWCTMFKLDKLDRKYHIVKVLVKHLRCRNVRLMILNRFSFIYP